MRRLMLGACALLVLAQAASAGTIYTNQAAWLAALSGQTINSLSLTPVTISPVTGGTVVDDEVTIVFPTGDIFFHAIANGWQGDVHSPTFGEPLQNTITFAHPITAFGGTVGIGGELSPTLDNIILTLDASTKLLKSDYFAGGTAFFGWIGTATSVLTVSTDFGFEGYQINNVQYVTAQAGSIVVPLPASVWAGLPLLGLCALVIHRRRTPAPA